MPSASASPQPPGLTQLSDIYGSACNRIPTQGPGSVLAMRNEPVGTAISNIPMLSTLTKAVRTAGLFDMLNQPNAAFTLLAPSDIAFQKLAHTELDTLLRDQTRLTQVLKYHLIPLRYNARGLTDTPAVNTVEGSNLYIAGRTGDLRFGRREHASVQCANIPTTNATVFIIDQVLRPPDQR